ncbi:unnamed protein product [Psylliodes chrysocephalus]|uniref:Uncharacterized protein n=1 Tax=Psylliodes chrysocephalus TaxID=3402493 RepID=A0A9P0GM21_9CUCU|nr:unnamed protein product [Psylliodes chrysocephala]
MHYKKFQKQSFYKNHSFAYSPRYSHINKPFFEDRPIPTRYLEKICLPRESKIRSRSSRSSEEDERCQGKYLKHIFNALKNKTSTELATFININSIPNEIEYELSCISFLDEPSKSVIPCDTYETYTVNTINKQVGCDCSSEDGIISNNSRTRGSDHIVPNFRVAVGNEKESEEKVDLNTNLEPQKNNYSEGQPSNKKKYHPYREVYEEKAEEKGGFLNAVLSLFKSKKESKTCNCEIQLEPIFRNNKCKCSETVVKLEKPNNKSKDRNIKCKCSETIVKLDKKFAKSKLENFYMLDRYKCEQCGLIDLDKLDHRCPNLNLDDDALISMLKLEANHNFNNLGTIQQQLKDQIKKIDELHRKYDSLMKIVKDKLSRGDLADISTETMGTRNQSSQLTSSCTCPPKKKSSIFVRLFKKSKCDASCKCCITPILDKSKCKYYLEKKNSKKKKEKGSKTSSKTSTADEKKEKKKRDKEKKKKDKENKKKDKK